MHADAVRPLVGALLGDHPPVRITLWDGSQLGADDGPGTIHLRSPDALRRMLWAPGELGLARAYVAGDLDVSGDLRAMLAVLRPAGRGLSVADGLKATPKALAAARRIGALGPPLPPPAIEATPKGRRHSIRRDRQAVSHHYDVGNDFYALVLGPSLTYSCAYYAEPDLDLTAAQAAKSELICRKLGLHERPGQRLLDVGCGWGSLAIHAAVRHDARVVGVTISEQQATLARRRAEAEGVADRVEIRLQDYRELKGERFDAVSSVGMFEHVGAARTAEYFSVIRSVLGPEGRFLNHAISSVGSSQLSPRSFVGRYVFPDGELLDVGEVVLAMEQAGFEVRDVEGLREHYARTLRAWVANLEAGWERAVELVGEPRARVWRLYMTASILGFEDGGNGLHQVLGVVADPSGRSGMPPTRNDLRVPESAYRTPSWSSTSSIGATSPVTKVPNSA
jgi:cyclopropane-fatty-acyl-phospholipid synthase